jgi:hypothetical protein
MIPDLLTWACRTRLEKEIKAREKGTSGRIE